MLDEPEEIDEWTRVLTADGYIGYIKDKRISAVTKTEIAAPEFEEPVYSNISKDYKINLTWHMVTNQAANDQLPVSYTHLDVYKRQIMSRES